MASYAHTHIYAEGQEKDRAIMAYVRRKQGRKFKHCHGSFKGGKEGILNLFSLMMPYVGKDLRIPGYCCYCYDHHLRMYHPPANLLR